MSKFCDLAEIFRGLPVIVFTSFSRECQTALIIFRGLFSGFSQIFQIINE